MGRVAQANTQTAEHLATAYGSARRGVGWSRGYIAATAALILLGMAVTRHAWADIAHIAYSDEESSHIFLVPIVFLWLLWTRREQAADLRPRASLLGPLVIALGGLSNWYGFYHFNQAAWHGGAVLIALGCFITLAGWRIVWRLLPAFAVLAFLIPVPGMIRQSISLPLQHATASATAGVYELFALDITQNGNVLRFNGEDIAVAEACNGMRMVFALVLVTYVVAFVTPLKNWVRALILVLSPVFAILCNVLRLLPTVWLYGYYPDTVGPVFHDLSGWVMIGVAFGLVLGLVHVMQWAEIPIMQAGAAGATGNQTEEARA